jgi:pantothenate kinase
MSVRGRGPRRIVGITGAPGVGKTTYALARVATSDVPAAYVPMDGFHLADASLRSLGRLSRKGAPDTFDAWGYAALLARLREEHDHVVWAPGFERDLEQPLAGALGVPPEAELVVTEGNYLLLDEPGWREVRDQLDEVVHLVTDDDDVRRRRLVARHVEFGKRPAEAEAWVTRVDDANARLVEAAAHRADRVVTLPVTPLGT